MTINKEKYPKTLDNLQCIGPCYKKGTVVTHPTIYSNVTANYDFCPTEQREIENFISGKKEKVHIGRCANPTYLKDEFSSKLLLTPKSEFTKLSFLGFYYGINSFDKLFDWIDNNLHLSLNTIIRNVNATIVVYGEDVELIDNRFALFFLKYLNKYAYTIYDSIHENIGKKNDDITIVKNSFLKKDEFMIQRINFMTTKFFTNDNIKSYIIKYFITNKKKLSDNDDNLFIMMNDFIIYIKKQIDKILLSL
ncbi:hypothetical protein BMW23_0619 [Bodo saltans virus]|uniref:Uncharacterized protein n=1 Tax=Bodo saltans virus TaxID=2024608 RepID=A0A2H4UV07_9VIRU|nr:hypothetical protein QJ851_gp0602 [Bodo saltans virus]ATZ80665.1 hypothetical protein BMW23_0619 [Bodo saltans virus]